MKRHDRHAWVDCTHTDDNGNTTACGMLICVYTGCGKKRPKVYREVNT